ncbi:CHASE2 domain-containing protein [Sphingomonas sp. ID0503]|uniref:CHASE2 domain-containing protein n=1 Tax=Sphingomonas sp. ID0503 TaxID=3399691 RepID=UPI003AFA25E0
MRNRLILEWLMAAMITCGLVIYLVQAWSTFRMDTFVYDRLVSSAALPPSDRIVIVAIDDDSIRRIGRWPWPREVHAELIDRLTKAGVKRVGYDVLFIDPSSGRGDDALAGAMRRNGDVHLPVYFQVPGSNGQAFDLIPPVPAIASAAAALDHVNLSFDPDGVVRGVSLLEGSKARNAIDLAESIYRKEAGRSSPAFDRASGTPLPAATLSRTRTVMLPFAGPPGTFRSISYASVLRGEVPASFLAGKIVLVGSTAAGSGDLYPVSGRHGVMPGVEIHANALNALLADRTITAAPLWLRYVGALLPVALLLAGFLMLSPRSNLLAGILLGGATIMGSVSLLWYGGIWLPPSPALIGLAFLYPLWAWRRLAAVNGYFVSELGRLAEEHDPLPTTSPMVASVGDPIARQSALLHGAIDRVRTLRHFFDDVVRGLPDVTVVTDADGKILVANAGADVLMQSLFGERPTTVGELLVRIAPKSQWRGLVQDDQEIATAQGAAYIVRSAPFRDAAGTVAGAIVSLIDITEMKVATRQREQVMELLTHDMRSPQAAILSLLDQSSPATDEQTLKRRVARYARRTLKLADDFVMLARAQSASYQREVLNLFDLVIEAADDLWPNANQRTMAIDVTGDGEDVLVAGDRSLLGRMLTNLMGNAIKYGHKGTRVTCVVEADGEWAVCSITDQGEGIPADRLSSLFQPFSRLPQHVGRVGGVGLGLAFVKSVVERHGGMITCDSREGVGTTFTVRLPLTIEDDPL